MGVGAMVFKPAMIAAQLFFHARDCLIRAGISIGGLTLGMQRHLGIKVNGALGAEPKTVFGERTWPGIPPSKYLSVASAIRPLTRSRKASPTSIFLPDMRNDMVTSVKSPAYLT